MGEYLRFVQQLATDGRKRGRTPLEVAQQAGLGPFAGLSDPERLAGNLHCGTAELDGDTPGGPIDLVAAMTDMIVLNGGRPMRTLV